MGRIMGCSCHCRYREVTRSMMGGHTKFPYLSTSNQATYYVFASFLYVICLILSLFLSFVSCLCFSLIFTPFPSFHCYLHISLLDDSAGIPVLLKTFLTIMLYRVSQEEWTKLRESFPFVELYRYNPKHLYPKLNGYGDNGLRKVWTSCISAYCTSTAVAH